MKPEVGVYPDDPDIVTCVCCDEPVPEEHATSFIHGTLVGRHHYKYRGVMKLEFDDTDVRIGYLCDYCNDTGPDTLPEKFIVASARVPWLPIGFVVCFVLLTIGSVITAIL